MDSSFQLEIGLLLLNSGAKIVNEFGISAADLSVRESPLGNHLHCTVKRDFLKEWWRIRCSTFDLET